jgi:hypothetical protein
MNNKTTRNSLSPCCGYKIKFNGFTGFHVGGSFSFSCEKCGKEWKADSLITLEEWKNIKRTELIDKILQ